MSNTITAGIPPDPLVSRTKRARPLTDIAIVAAASALAFVLEEFVGSRGWITVGADARGVTAVVVGALAAICVVLARGETFANLGFRRPERWAIVPFQVAGILAAFVAVQTLVPLLVSAFIELPEPDLSRYSSIYGNLSAAIGFALLLALTASIPEEIIYRGFLIGRLSEVFGRSTRGAIMTVLVQAVVFGAIHFQWAVGGMIMTFIMGIVWGTAYLLCGRNLWVVILAHSGGHILLVTQLYLTKPIV